jgi:hypothetical protein
MTAAWNLNLTFQRFVFVFSKIEGAFQMYNCCYIAYFRSIVQDLLSQTHVCFLKPLSQT